MIRMLFIAVVLLTGACSSKGPVIPYPEAPGLVKNSVAVTIARERSEIDPAEVIRDVDYFVKERSTFVISVPTDYVEESATKDTKNIRGADSLKATGGNIELYNTSGYFNYAEQQIEKALIRLGYRVIDRSKFEAKLRERRHLTEITRTTGVIGDRIDRSAFDQLRDISELIRAAHDGDIRSDYILQINQLQLKKGLVSMDLTNDLDIEAFKDRHPEVANRVPKSYRFPEYSVTFNAKLIDVQSGRIIWLGSHEVTSRNILEQDIVLTMTMRKYVKNKDEVMGFVDYQNTESQRKERGEEEINIPSWEYGYEFDMTVTPDLNELEREQGLPAGDVRDSKEKFYNHRDKLLKLVTSMLIDTLRGV